MRIIDYTSVGDCLWQLESLRSARRVILLTDVNVHALYPSIFEGQSTIVMAAGEEAKNFDTYQNICRQLFDLRADRSTLIVGVGGGVVTDMAGFVAATYMRGIACGFVATTLLSQIDASIGGKNGIDVGGYKNIVGTFAEPEFVLCDPLFLNTLPERELRAGYAEVIKYALLCDLSIVDDPNMVARCVEHKLAVVAEDFRDGGRRKLLNLGHTFAHAIEKCNPAYNHGEAVAIGLSIMARVSCSLGYLQDSEVSVIEKLITSHSLPTTHLGIADEELLDAVKFDKKRQSDGLEMILLDGLCRPITRCLSFAALGDAYYASR